MSYPANFRSDLIKATETVAAKGKRFRSDDVGLEICAQLRALPLCPSGAKECAYMIADEAGKVAARAELDGRWAHFHIASAARLLALVWVDVLVLGTENLTDAFSVFKDALSHLEQG